MSQQNAYAMDLKFASSSVQGRRPYNEDRAHIAHPLKPHLPSSSSSSSSSSCSFFAVYDGHGGEECAEYCARHLHEFIAHDEHYELMGSRHRAIERGFLACDEALVPSAFSPSSSESSSSSSSAVAELPPDWPPVAAPSTGESGTTCSCILIDSSFIYSGNCGDSRNVLCRDGRAIRLSIDHKPTDDEERARIEAAGARVTIQQLPLPKLKNPQATLKSRAPVPQQQAYVELEDCGLAVSRAFGDRVFKRDAKLTRAQQAIVATPHVNATERSSRDEFLLSASDGLWNFIDEERVIEFVRARLHSETEEERDVEDIVNKLTQHALDKKSNDNVTVVLIVFPAASPCPSPKSSSLSKPVEETKNE